MYLPSEVYYFPAVFRIFFWVLTGFFSKRACKLVRKKQVQSMDSKETLKYEDNAICNSHLNTDK